MASHALKDEKTQLSKLLFIFDIQIHVLKITFKIQQKYLRIRCSNDDNINLFQKVKVMLWMARVGKIYMKKFSFKKLIKIRIKKKI